MKQLPLIQVNPKNGDRYYVNEYKPSLKYASVTNVLAKTVSKTMAYGLGIWRQKQVDAGLDPDIELKKAAQRGSDLHNWTEQYLNGETPRVLPEYKQYTDKIQQCPIWKHIDEVLCTEQKVCSDKNVIPFAGTFDALLKINGKTVLFDLKTKNADKGIPTKELTNEALCQMQAYRVCLKENHDMDVDRFIALYVYPDQPAYPVHASGEALTIYENLWIKRLKQYANQQLWQ
tara:strand:- start:107 stop:799 length:693 start_codon:yes stop_codon:yes gene_type:complete